MNFCTKISTSNLSENLDVIIYKINKYKKWHHKDCDKSSVIFSKVFWNYQQGKVSLYLFKINNKSIRKRCEICSMLLIKYQNDVIDVVLVFEIIEVRQRYVLLLLPPYEITLTFCQWKCCNSFLWTHSHLNVSE